MKEEDKLKEKYGTQGPWRVPDGYFEAVRLEITSKLPDYPELPKPVKLSLWQRCKPYVYLAAMFAGIWLMMNIFHRVGGMGDLNIDNPPAQLAALMSDPEITEIHEIVYSDDDDAELIDDVTAQYDNIQDFERDFDYQLNPQYADINL